MQKPHLDHILILVEDLDKTCADMAALGFTVQERADTQHSGTAFRFVSFQDGSYILLTSFTDPKVAASHRLAPVLKEGEGWADYSFVVDDLEASISRAKAAGVTLGKVADVRNVVKSGEQWGLRLLVAGRGAQGDDALPFVVEDTVGRDIRIPSFKPHANGVTHVTSISIGSPDPARTAVSLRALLGIEKGADDHSFKAGALSVNVVANAPGLAGRRNMGGLVAAQMKSSEQAGLLDLKLTHGAHITLVNA
jgi:catechol 2,3-dioxygenase-like lactoylglutathione lyase family enzyme